MSDFDERDLLTRELQERAADVAGSHIGFDAVRGSARRIRRRRQVVSGAVAAVVLGVAVPTGLAVTGSLSSAPGPTHEPPVATRSSDEPTMTPRPDGTFPLTTKGLPRGEHPQRSYVVGDQRVLVTPDGDVELPDAYSQAVPYQGGWLALVGGDNGFENVALDGQADIERTTPGGDALALSTDGSRVLRVERDFGKAGRTVVVDEATSATSDQRPRVWDTPAGGSVAPVGYLDESTVVFQLNGEQGSQVVLGRYDEGPLTQPLRRFLRVNATSEASGLVAGMISYDVMEACYGAIDPRVSLSRPVWTSCDYEPLAFSPDGRYLVAGAPDADALGSPSLSVLDAGTGEPLVELRPGKDVALGVTQVVWEDEDTILANVVEGNEMTMLRVELSGRLEAVTDRMSAMDGTVPFWFADVPR